MVRIFFLFLGILIFTSTAEPASAFKGCARKAESKSAFQQIKQYQLPADADIQRNPANQTLRLLRGKNLSEFLEQDISFQKMQSENQVADIARTFLSACSETLRLNQPADELNLESVRKDQLGLKHVRFRQIFKNIPIWVGEITVHLDKANHVYRVDGHYIPTPSNLNIKPTLTKAEAFLKVSENLATKDDVCPKCSAELVIFAPASGSPQLAYRIFTVPSLVEGWIFFIDAHTGQILKKLSTVHTDGLTWQTDY